MAVPNNTAGISSKGLRHLVKQEIHIRKRGLVTLLEENVTIFRVKLPEINVLGESKLKGCALAGKN